MELYNYIFHYSCLTEMWSAFNRKNYRRYFNGELGKDEVIQSKNVMDLVEIVKKIEKDA